MRYQMERSTESFAALAHARKMELADSKEQITKMLQTFNRTRVKMAEELKSSLVSDRMRREDKVGRLLVDACASRAAFMKTHRHMARLQQVTLAKDRRNRSRDVVELINNFHILHSRMARVQAEHLKKSTEQLRSYVFSLRGSPRMVFKKNEKAASASEQTSSYAMNAQRSSGDISPFSTHSHTPETPEEKTKIMPNTKVNHSAGQTHGKPHKR